MKFHVELLSLQFELPVVVSDSETVFVPDTHPSTLAVTVPSDDAAYSVFTVFDHSTRPPGETDSLTRWLSSSSAMEVGQ